MLASCVRYRIPVGSYSYLDRACHGLVHDLTKDAEVCASTDDAWLPLGDSSTTASSQQPYISSLVPGTAVPEYCSVFEPVFSRRQVKVLCWEQNARRGERS